MKFIIGNLVFLPFACSMMGVALAQDDEDNDEFVVQSCVNNRILRSPEILDNKRIVFHASRNRLYLNILPNNCHGLKRAGRIVYQQSSRLCADDWFNVLERSGTKLHLGVSCQLGNFVLITDEQLEELRNPTPVIPPAVPVTPPPVEDVVTDEAEDAEQTPAQ